MLHCTLLQFHAGDLVARLYRFRVAAGEEKEEDEEEEEERGRQ